MFIDLDDLMLVRILNEHFVLLDVNVGKLIIIVVVVVIKERVVVSAASLL